MVILSSCLLVLMSRIRFVAFGPTATRSRLSFILTLPPHRLLHVTLDCISQHLLHWLHRALTNHTLTWKLYTHYNTLSEPVQITEYCSTFIIVIADSHFTEPVLVFRVIVIVSPVIFPCFDSNLCILDLPFTLTFWTLFAPAWTIAMYLDYLSLPCPVGYSWPIEDLHLL